ncbi:MAG: CE1759 family FMN reductase, partial [Ornithinimicrobium sp.]
MTSRELSVVVVSAGVNTPSSTRLLAERIGHSVGDRLRVRDVAVDVRFIDVRDLGMDVTSAIVNAGRRSAVLERANAAIAAADAVIAVTPVFAGSYSGLFKSFFDVIEPDALRGTPVLIAATGGSARHSLILDHAMRPLFAYFGALVLPTGVFAATSDFGTAASAGDGLSERIDRAADELSVVLAHTGREAANGATSASGVAPRAADDLSAAESMEAGGTLPDFG